MNNPETISLLFKTRWPMKQTGEKAFLVTIPVGQGEPVLNPRFVENMRLSETEAEAAETSALREIAVILS